MELYRNTKQTHYIICSFCFILSLFICPNTTSARSVENKETEPAKIDLKVNQMKLEQVTMLISQQTGCTILLEPKLSNVLVSGYYSNVSIEEFFQRALRKMNLTFEFDSISNIFKVSSFPVERQPSQVAVFGKSKYTSLKSQEDNDFRIAERYIAEPPHENTKNIDKELSFTYIDNLNKEQAQKEKDFAIEETTLVGLGMTLKELDMFNSNQKIDEESKKTQ